MRRVAVTTREDLACSQERLAPERQLRAENAFSSAVVSIFTWNLNVAEPSHEWLALRDQTEKARLDFIWTDLGVLLRFAAIVETRYKMGDWEHAERTLAEAEKGYFILTRMFSKAHGLTAELQEKFQLKFAQLQARLDGLKRLR